MILTHVEQRFPGHDPRSVGIREYLAVRCQEFVDSGLADPKYVDEIASGSEQKFWACVSEALIFERLQDHHFGERERLGTGPDFLIMDGPRRVWIEVVCPEPTNLPFEWRNFAPGGVTHFPHEEILLRWTSAIKAKAEALIGSPDGCRRGYLESGVVGREDAYVIAVNGCLLRNGPFTAFTGISQAPVAAEAVFPIGPVEIQINRETLEVVGRGHQHRPYVINQNGAEVPAYTFLDPRFNAISAIWACDFSGASAIGSHEPSAVIHNPNATNPIPIGLLTADDEYVASEVDDGYELRRITP